MNLLPVTKNTYIYMSNSCAFRAYATYMYLCRCVMISKGSKLVCVCLGVHTIVPLHKARVDAVVSEPAYRMMAQASTHEANNVCLLST